MDIAAWWAPYASRRVYEAGEYIVREGEAADTVFLLLSGQLAVVKGANGPLPLVLNYRHQTEMIGEVSLLAAGERTASLLALDRSEVLAMPEVEFWRLFDSDTDFRQQVMRTVIDRLLLADESRLRAAESERLLFEQIGALSDQNEQLARLMHLRQETMAFLVHDLRNPLSVVGLALTMIEEDEAYQPDEDSRQLLKMAQNGVQRMMGMVESLLDVERLEADQSLLEVAPTDPQALVDERVAQQRPLAATKDVTLVVAHGDAEPPVVTLDRERIGRVITNLLDNAVKFSPPRSEVRITTRTMGQRFTVAVEDSGPGIPPEQRENVFARFAQAAGSARSQGFGLGLTFCRMAVEAHGGKIRAAAAEELGGTRFEFWLPVD